MKTIIRSVWTSLCRDLCTLFTCIAVLCVTPGNARAQIYVGQSVNGTVIAYDTITGSVEPNFTAITANGPFGLALSGNNLFVTNNGAGTVGEYSASTGAAINASLIVGLSSPWGVAVSANDLFVAQAVPQANAGTVGEYNFATGSFNPNFITGLNVPQALLLSGNNLYVAENSGTVLEYDATAGVVNTSFSLNTGIAGPGGGLALSGNDLFVSSEQANMVGEYDATTGAAINPSLITGLSAPKGLAVSGNGLFVANANGIDAVGEYNLVTGTFTPLIITVPNAAYGLAVAPISEPSPWSMIAVGGVALMGFMARRRRSTPAR